MQSNSSFLVYHQEKKYVDAAIRHMEFQLPVAIKKMGNQYIMCVVGQNSQQTEREKRKREP